jgi:hypothetical protein
VSPADPVTELYVRGVDRTLHAGPPAQTGAEGRAAQGLRPPGLDKERLGQLVNLVSNIALGDPVERAGFARAAPGGGRSAGPRTFVQPMGELAFSRHAN